MHAVNAADYPEGRESMCLTKMKIALAVLLMVGFSALAPSRFPKPPEETKPNEKAKAKTQASKQREEDQAGQVGDEEPLPAGALARLGTTRLRHGNSIRSLDVSPDGKTLVTVSPVEGGEIHVWDLATGKLIRQLGDVRSVDVAVFSPDGQTLAYAGSEGSVYLRRAATGAILHQTPRDTFKSIISLVFSPDGKVVAAGSDDIALWDVGSGNLRRRIAREGNDDVKALAFSPNGKLLAAEDLRVIRLWDPATGKEVRHLEGRLHVNCLAFTPDGKFLAAGGWHGDVHLWEVATGKRLRVFKEHRDRLASLAISPDGKYLAAGGGFRSAYAFSGSDNTVRIWDIATERTVHVLPGNAHTVYALAFTPDSKTLITGSDLPRLWDVATGQRRLAFASHEHAVVGLCFLPGGTMRTVSLDGTSRTWKTATGSAIHRLALPIASPSDVAISANGEHIACGDRDGTVQVVAADTVRNIRRWPDKYPETVNGLTLSPDGDLLIVRKRVDFHLYQVATGDFVHSWTDHKTHERDVDSPVFSPDGRYLAWANQVPHLHSDNEAVYIRDLIHGTRFRTIQLDRPASALAFSPDGRTLAIGEVSAHRVRGWEVASGKPRWILTPPEKMYSASLKEGSMRLAFAPNGRLLAFGGGTMVLLWDTVRQQRLRLLPGHKDHIARLVFSPDGQFLASGSWDTTALIWDLRSTEEKKLTAVELNPAQLHSLWDELGGADAEIAYHAIQTLAAAPHQAVPFLRERMTSAKPAEARLIDRLIADLESDRFEVRERAVTELKRLGPLAGPALRRTLANRPPLETRRRLEPLLEEVAQRRFTTEELRLVRAVETLESSGDPQAHRLLEVLAKGAAEAWLTREAKAALERLARRHDPKP